MTTRNWKKRNETGTDSAGQSGDIQGIHSRPGADSESVEELVEEGNAFEAAAVYGVESAQAPDVAEVSTREFSEDDVPDEYLNNYVDVMGWDNSPARPSAHH